MLGANISFRNYVDGVKNLKGLDYKYVYFDGDFLIDVKTNELKSVYSFIKEFNLVPFSLHNLWMFPDDYKKINEFIDFQKENFEKAKILNVKYLTCHFGWPKDLKEKEDFNFEIYLNRKGIKKDDYRKLNIELLNTLYEKAKEYELYLTIENLPPDCLGNFTTTIDDMLGIIKEVNQPNLGICFDSGHANIAKLNLYDFVIKAGNKIFETHFHDNIGYLKDDNSINDLHQPCGIGNINWIEIMKGLEEINYKNPVVFEIGADFKVLEINKNNWFKFYYVFKNRLRSL